MNGLVLFCPQSRTLFFFIGAIAPSRAICGCCSLTQMFAASVSLIPANSAYLTKTHAKHLNSSNYTTASLVEP